MHRLRLVCVLIAACSRVDPHELDSPSVTVPHRTHTDAVQPRVTVPTGAAVPTRAAAPQQLAPPPAHAQCTGECLHHAGANAEPRHAATRTVAAGAQAPAEQLFGAAPSGAPLVALAELLEHPSDYAGRQIALRGHVARVCQRMGCWMELRADGETVRVPMAGHSFFLPLDCAGQRAEVEGTVSVAPLSDAMREHLRSEGALHTDALVSVEATSVRLSAP